MKNNWRLGRTLKRHVEVRAIEQDDVKFAWAAYKKGALDGMGFPQNLEAQAFKEAFEVYVLTQTHACWTILGKTDGRIAPVAFVLGEWAPKQAFMLITGICWFPWASKRNIVEGTVRFFDILRKQMKWMGFAAPEHKRLYEICCMHSIMRRVGTSNLGKNPIAVFEGKT